ncbi:MAG: hypothetical protein ACR2HM_09515 [Acidimicrobiales bacterium]
MISLGYRLSDEWNKEHLASEVARLDETTLRYGFFMGDVEFRIDEASFDARWGWVPILDFAASLLSLMRSLPKTREAAFEFTESEAQISFAFKDSAVEVGATYSPATAAAPYDAMLAAVEAFALSTFDAAETVYPSIGANTAYIEMRSMTLEP